MSDRLYTSSGSGGHIKIDHIEKALKNAKLEGKLNGVPSFIIPKFVERFQEMLEDPEIKSRIGSQITGTEAEFVIDRMKKNKTDELKDNYLEIIRSVLTNQSFDIE